MRRFQGRGRRLGTAKHAQQIDLQQRLPQLLGDHVQFRRVDFAGGARRAGIGEQQVQTAEIGDGFVDHRNAIRCVADAAGCHDGLAAAVVYLIHRVWSARVVGQEIDGDGATEAGQHRRGSEADAGCAAGDQSGLTGKIVTYHLPSIGPIARNACFSASSFRSRSRNSSSGDRSPQSKYPLPAMTPVRPSSISLSSDGLRSCGTGGV